MRAYLAAVLAAALAVVIPACGTDSGNHTGRSTDNANAAHVGAAMAQISRARTVPAFVAPGPAFDAAARLRGKTIFEIPITSEVPFIAAVEGGMRQAAAKVGARLVIYPNQGKPEQWAQGIRTAIAERADAITLFAQDPRLLAPQIAQAKMAGIPVVVVRTDRRGRVVPDRRLWPRIRHRLRPRPVRAGREAGGGLGDRRYPREGRRARRHLQ